MRDPDGTENNLPRHTIPFVGEMTGAAQPVRLPYWLIARYGVSRVSVFTIRFAGGEEALPVFSDAEEAGTFLLLAAPEGDWRIRETGAGELVSVLLSVGRNVRRVLLDPTPDLGAWAELVSMGRKSFMDLLVSRGESRLTGAGVKTGG